MINNNSQSNVIYTTSTSQIDNKRIDNATKNIKQTNADKVEEKSKE